MKNFDEMTAAEKLKIVSLAQRILSGQIGVIEGCWQIADITGVIINENSQKELLPFVRIADDTDHLPVGDVRKYWVPEALIEKDKEINSIEKSCQESIFKACREVIAHFPK